MTEAAGHADRIVPMQNYVKGLLLPLERKSVEPMAARLAPGNVRQMHQSLHHIVAEAAWSDEAVLAEVRRQVLPSMTRQHPLAAWIVDDTGFPKKGTHSVSSPRNAMYRRLRISGGRAVPFFPRTTLASGPRSRHTTSPTPTATRRCRSGPNG